MDTLGKAGRNASPIQYAWKALMENLQADLPVKGAAPRARTSSRNTLTPPPARSSPTAAVWAITPRTTCPTTATRSPEDDPYAAFAQAAADAAAAAGDTTTEPTE